VPPANLLTRQFRNPSLHRTTERGENGREGADTQMRNTHCSSIAHAIITLGGDQKYSAHIGVGIMGFFKLATNTRRHTPLHPYFRTIR